MRFTEEYLKKVEEIQAERSRIIDEYINKKKELKEAYKRKENKKILAMTGYKIGDYYYSHSGLFKITGTYDKLVLCKIDSKGEPSKSIRYIINASRLSPKIKLKKTNIEIDHFKEDVNKAGIKTMLELSQLTFKEACKKIGYKRSFYLTEALYENGYMWKGM